MIESYNHVVESHSQCRQLKLVILRYGQHFQLSAQIVAKQARRASLKRRQIDKRRLFALLQMLFNCIKPSNIVGPHLYEFEGIGRNKRVSSQLRVELLLVLMEINRSAVEKQTMRQAAHEPEGVLSQK